MGNLSPSVLLLIPVLAIIILVLGYRRYKKRLQDTELLDVRKTVITPQHLDMYVLLSMKPFAHYSGRFSEADYKRFAQQLAEFNESEYRFYNRYGSIQSYFEWLQGKLDAASIPLNALHDVLHQTRFDGHKQRVDADTLRPEQYPPFPSAVADIPAHPDAATCLQPMAIEHFNGRLDAREYAYYVHVVGEMSLALAHEPKDVAALDDADTLMMYKLLVQSVQMDMPKVNLRTDVICQHAAFAAFLQSPASEGL